MLSLIFGRSGSGKTTEMQALIQQRAKRGEHSVLLVAEQYTSTTELSVLRRFGDELCHYITVADFGRLSEMTFREYGGTKQFVSDAYRVALCKRAVISLTGQLTYYNAESYKIGFYSLCADIIKELKTCCSPEQLNEIATDGKLRDIALIYSAYNSLLSDRMEPQDVLLLAANGMLKHPEFMNGHAFFIDGFDGFTLPEYEIIRALLAGNKNITVALGAPTAQQADDFFDTVRQTAKHLVRIASAEGVSIAPNKILYNNFRNNGDIEQLNLMLCGEEDVVEEFSDITLTPYENTERETFAVAAAVAAEVRAGRAYRDIAIVMRNPDEYYSELLKSFALFNIPVYLDLEGELRYSAPASMVSAMISLRGGINSDDMLTLVSTGLCGLSTEKIAALQDWVLRFNPTAKEWRNGVVIPPEDISSNKSWCGGEPVREELINCLQPLFANDTPLTVAIYQAITALNVAENLSNDDILRRYNLIIEILDQLHSLNFEANPGHAELKPDELQQLYTILLQNTKLHSLPKVVDCVTVYSPERIIGDSIKSLYVLGVNSEVFPAEVGHSGLLDHADRERLAEHDLQLPGLFKNRVMLEELYLYRTLTTPSENLHISYITENGAKLSTQLMPIESYAKRLLQNRLNEVATPSAAAVVMAQRLHDDKAFAEELKQAIKLFGGERLIEAVEVAQKPPCFDLNERQTTQNLINNLSLSSGRVSSYKKCAFSFFMQHLLKVEPIRRLELSADIAGTLIHHVMERLLAEHPSLSKLSDDDLFSLCRKYTIECTDRLFGDRVSVKERFIIGRLEQSAAQLLLFLRAEQQDSIFRPEKLEQNLSHSITTDDGINITLRGKVDRIDSCSIDGERYIRVVDYKTGSKTFSLKDVETGVDIQLFLYLAYAVKENEIPAGTFYLHNRPKEEDGKLLYRYDGAALNEEKSLKALCLKHTTIKTKAEGTISSGQENRLFDRPKAERIKRHINQLLCDVAKDMLDGNFDARPLKMANSPCDYCGYRIICRKTDSDSREKEVLANKKPFEI